MRYFQAGPLLALSLSIFLLFEAHAIKCNDGDLLLSPKRRTIYDQAALPEALPECSGEKPEKQNGRNLRRALVLSKQMMTLPLPDSPSHFYGNIQEATGCYSYSQNGQRFRSPRGKALDYSCDYNNYRFSVESRKRRGDIFTVDVSGRATEALGTGRCEEVNENFFDANRLGPMSVSYQSAEGSNRYVSLKLCGAKMSSISGGAIELFDEAEGFAEPVSQFDKDIVPECFIERDGKKWLRVDVAGGIKFFAKFDSLKLTSDRHKPVCFGGDYLGKKISSDRLKIVGDPGTEAGPPPCYDCEPKVAGGDKTYREVKRAKAELGPLLRFFRVGRSSTAPKPKKPWNPFEDPSN